MALLGKRTSEAKKAAAIVNGRKGGRKKAIVSNDLQQSSQIVK